MTPEQRAEILRAADHIEQAAKILGHSFWLTLSPADRYRIEGIAGMENLDQYLVTELREIAQ